MTRLSLKDQRPDTTSACYNAKDGCPNRAPFGKAKCDDCRRGRPVKPMTGLAALLDDVKRYQSGGVTLFSREDALAKLKRLVGPSALDDATERTLDNIPALQDEQFRRVVREFCDTADTTLAKICRRASVPFGKVWDAFKYETELSVAHMNRIGEAMRHIAGLS